MKPFTPQQLFYPSFLFYQLNQCPMERESKEVFSLLWLSPCLPLLSACLNLWPRCKMMPTDLQCPSSSSQTCPWEFGECCVAARDLSEIWILQNTSIPFLLLFLKLCRMGDCLAWQWAIGKEDRARIWDLQWQCCWNSLSKSPAISGRLSFILGLQNLSRQTDVPML